MQIRRSRSLLPKRCLISAFYTKSKKYFQISYFTKAFLAPVVLFSFLSYQPALAIPPVKLGASNVQAFAQENSIKSSSFSEAFLLPHPGFLTTKFSPWHKGVDIATGLGMPIHPIVKGKVVQVIYGFFGLGHYVIVEHEQGLRSTYGHMGRIFVKTGDNVSQSSILGEVGVTGWTSGPHTHLEITKGGGYIDPLLVLPAIADLPLKPAATSSAKLL